MSATITVDGVEYEIDQQVAEEFVEDLAPVDRLAARLNAQDGVKCDVAGETEAFVLSDRGHNRNATRAIHDEGFVVLDVEGYGKNKRWDHFIYAVDQSRVM